MAFDFNGAEQQREGGLIADGTIAVVHLTVRPGNAGEGGWLKRSKDGSSQALDCEFTVVDGPSAKRKFWSLFTVEGTTEGHAKAADISASRLRGILESAKGIRPDDESEAAKAGRRVNSWGDFDGLRFVAKIGIEKAKEGSGYKDKNTLDAAVTPDRKTWIKVEQVARPASAAPANVAAAAVAAQATAGAGKPAWAQ
ncbi:hypothetical protein [Bradyrhizobium sp. 62]|uniref:hypothetical protein n=1 Tax=Bradyrhizobium sp. 62 TaxID=1043588 RepID=UPI001FFB7D81|nr:hypothetical protein [Bradyrhizobium sp. 62]MCK1367648.1 hypothetical protein [Bradyrhizobium sp. 62]